MNKYNYIDYCLTILAFDNIKPQLSIQERCYLHKQWVAAVDHPDHTEFSINAKPMRIAQLGLLIKEANWQRPKLRYNQDRVLEVNDAEKGTWKKFIPSHYE